MDLGWLLKASQRRTNKQNCTKKYLNPGLEVGESGFRGDGRMHLCLREVIIVKVETNHL